MEIVLFSKSDMDEVVKMMYDTVHTICAGDYTKKQLEAWMPKDIDKAWILHSLRGCIAVTVRIDGRIVGFGDMDKKGFINRLYTHKDFQRQGVGRSIINYFEDCAKRENIRILSLESSITARPFYEKCGFCCVGTVVKFKDGEKFQNFVMRKSLKS